MITDGRRLRSGHVVETDLCIVGAGPAGLTLAEALRSSGLNVCVLESGGSKPAYSSLNEGRIEGDACIPLRISRQRGLGGSSGQWFPAAKAPFPDGGLRCLPLGPLDLSDRPWVTGSGWPLEGRDLEPYYQRARTVLGLPAAGPVPRPPPGYLLEAGFEAVAFSFAGSDVFLLKAEELRADPDIAFLTNTTAVRVERGAADRVTGVRALTIAGSEVSIRARATILAGGGIENARLLLNSPDLEASRGPAGKYFMDHVQVAGAVVSGPGLSDLLARARRSPESGDDVLTGWRLDDRIQAEEGLLSAVISPHPTLTSLSSEGVRAVLMLRHWLRSGSVPPNLRRHTRAVIHDLPGVGRAIRFALHPRRGGAPDTMRVVIQCEQPPLERNRLSLEGRLDSLGMPRSRLSWKISEAERRTIRCVQERFDAAVRAAGLRLETIVDGPIEGSFHHMGTTRMHRDPNLGVVDADCRVHGTEGLYVAGSSVFPTGGASTATLTLVALAVRLADHLKLSLHT